MIVRSRASAFGVTSALLLAVLISGAAIADQDKGTTPAPDSPASSAQATGFWVKPSDVTIPADVPIGQYRRVTRPFPNWTLICDENLQKKQKVCNVSQTIVKGDGNVVFSWSLAATQNGQPFFILRTPPTVGERGAIELNLPDGISVIAVPVKGCDEKVCVAYQPVGPRLRAAIDKGLVVQLSYVVAGSPPGTVSFGAPFEGLSSALAGI